MGEWFRKAFGEDYSQVYAHRDAAEAHNAVAMLVEKTGLPQGALVLDAPCGAGRHLQAFRCAGMRAVGFDLSRHLLSEAVRHNGQGGQVARADLRALPFRPATCDMVVNLFSSLGYFDSDEENFSVLRSLGDLVVPTGWLVVDFMHSAYIQANLQPETKRLTESGIHVHDTRWLSDNPVRVNKRTELLFPDGRRDELRESVRLFSPEELEQVFVQFGFKVCHRLGSYAGEEFSINSNRIILVGQRA